MLADKLGLALTIGFLAVSACTASAAGITRIYQNNRHTSQPSLVLHERAQLEETPVAEAAAKAFRNSCLYADTDILEIFKSNPCVECLSFLDQLLTNGVISVCLKPSLTTRHFLQPAFSVFSSFSLILLTGCGPAPSVSVDSFSRERISRRIGRNVNDSQVYADECLNFSWWRLRQFNSGQKIELSATVNEITLSFDAVKPLTLILAVNHANNLAASQRGKTDAIQAFERKISLIVGNGAVRAEPRTNRLVAGETFDSFADGADSQLGGQSESLADGKIGQMMHAWLAEDASFRRHVSGERGSFVKLPHRIKKQRSLLGRWQ